MRGETQRDQVVDLDGRSGFVTESPAMLRVAREIEALASVASTVLITGETGVGKGMVARAIHSLSSRSRLPFVSVDCGGLSASLVESELFGHERGAFTGAERSRAGRFELAGAGSVFLDEIAELPLSLQPKLLRVLEDRCFERLGGVQTRAMTARVLAATHRDLEALVKQGRFRSDLMFRLDVCRVHVPPLRERREEIPHLLAAAFERHGLETGHGIPAPPKAFYRWANEYSWPGNVRELFNVAERWIVNQRSGAGLCREAWWQDRRPLQPTFDYDVQPAPLRQVQRLERQLIADALAESGGNVSRAARRLAVPRSTLRYRIRLLRLEEFVAKP